MKEREEGLSRFLKAQEDMYEEALSEIRAGRKRSHWMWFIFPQIKGLGHSGIAAYYAIRDLDEARDYLKDPVLGERLEETAKALLDLGTDDASAVFGYPDDLKLRSSMTVFLKADPENPVFRQVLEKFFGGEEDPKTIALLAEG